MKALRALTLVLAFSVYAYAEGNMPNLPPAAPPDSGVAGTVATGEAREMDNGAFATTDATVTKAILSLLQSVLSAF